MKNKIKLEILEKISIMEQNTFLLPVSWSEMTDMIEGDWSYKTYNSGNKGMYRYHNLEIWQTNKKIIDINFRGTEIEVVRNLDFKPINYKDVLFYVTSIFNEKHSFKNHSEGKRKIRENINKKLLLIETTKKEISVLKQQLTDINELK